MKESETVAGVLDTSISYWQATRADDEGKAQAISHLVFGMGFHPAWHTRAVSPITSRSALHTDRSLFVIEPVAARDKAHRQNQGAIPKAGQ
jgi:hypothetical protein